MNVLIIEDLDNKANAILNAMANLGLNAEPIKRQKSITTGCKALSEQHFDLLVLDLMLPMRDGGKPLKNAGTEILNEIVSGNTVIKPTHIICLTEYPNLADVLDSQILLSLVHVINYSETDSKWKETLKAKCSYISSRLKEGATLPIQHLVDLAIITSSPSIELSEVLRLDHNFHGEFHKEDAHLYYLSKWKNHLGKELKVIACAAPHMGMTSACTTTHKVIERWRPKYVIMCGIAAGTKPEFNYGDILIGEMIFDYGSGKISDTKSGKRVFIPDPRPLTIDDETRALLQVIERNQDGIVEIMKAWQGKSIRQIPKIRMGVIASGAAVVQSNALLEEMVLKTSRKTIGLEMEAYGFAYAAHFSKKPKPKFIVLKSVSDYADNRKNDDWQQLAAFTSARFAHYFVTSSKELTW
jgi:nucleoside phosphorylase/CheY-like chemotaxis protein